MNKSAEGKGGVQVGNWKSAAYVSVMMAAERLTIV